MFYRKFYVLTLLFYSIINPKICLAKALDENPNPQPTSESILTQTQKSNETFIILPVGINVGKRNVNESALVRGLEDGSQAVNFDNWLLSFDDVISALNITTTTLDDGQIELRSPSLVTRINPKNLKTDPELGLVLSVAEIKNTLGVPTEFDIVKYAVVFKPPWLDSSNQRTRQQEQTVVLEGLTKVNPPAFSFSTIGQSINISGNNSDTTAQGDLTTIGTLFGGSWYIRTNQPNLTDRNTWQLNEAQYLRQTDSADYVVGSQPRFWQSQGNGQYWGVTTVQRFGYTSPQTITNGFNPSQRMQSRAVGRSISGEAAPGTLVQLVTEFGDNLIASVLVDSSGVYRFENIPTGEGTGSFNSYRLRLYPNGQLTATPEIREANFSTLPGQLSKHTSALIISSGFSRENTSDSLIGNFTDWRGGVAYRLGVTEDLTLGTGVIYDRSLLGLGEIFYQPASFPLRVAFSGLLGTEKGLEYNADIRLLPARNFELSFNSDELSQTFSANWQAFRGVSFRFSGNTRENALAAGINLSYSSRNILAFASADIDTNNNWRLNLNSRLGKLQLTHRSNEIRSNSLITYNFSGTNYKGHSLNLGYETGNNNNLASLSWRYRSTEKTLDGRNLWDFDIGYGIGSRGSGIIASVSTTAIPGLNLRLRYQGTSTTDDSDSFRIELTPSFNLQPRLTPGDSRYERLRSEGGLFIQPFLDKNGNGRLDKNEKIYTEDADLLLIVNNKPIKRFQTNVTDNGLFIKLSPDNYRLDLDPAGYPLDWKPTESAYAVEVVAGGYTPVLIPFSPSYTVAGALTDAEGKLVGGARVEAIPKEKGKKVFSVTNDAGVFFLENLQQGTYDLFINGEPAQPQNITIDGNSEAMQELNLKLFL